MQTETMGRSNSPYPKRCQTIPARATTVTRVLQRSISGGQRKILGVTTPATTSSTDSHILAVKIARRAPTQNSTLTMVDTSVENNPCSYAVCCLFSVFLLISCILLGVSFDIMRPTEMGFRFNRNTMKLNDEEVIGAERGTGGRFFVGLGQGFDYKFSRSYVQMKLNGESDADSGPISARLSSGVPVDLSLAFQLRLHRDVESVRYLITAYGGDFKPYYVRYTRDVSRDVLSKFDVYDMWEKRSEVRLSLFEALSAKLANHSSELRGLQLLELTIPSEVQSAIETTTVEEQHIEEAQRNLEAVEVVVQTSILTAEQDARITLVNAAAEAFSIEEAANAEAVALNRTIEAETMALKAFQTHLNMNTTALLNLAYIDAMLETDARRLLLAVDQPTNTMDLP